MGEISNLVYREPEELKVDRGIITHHFSQKYNCSFMELILNAIIDNAPTEEEFNVFVATYCVYGQWFKQTRKELLSIYKLMVDGLEVNKEDALVLINKHIIGVSINNNTINIETTLTDEELENASEA